MEQRYGEQLASHGDAPATPGSPGSGSYGPSADAKLAAVTVDGMNLRTLSYLVSVMNQVFSDYDFTDVIDGKDFVKLPARAYEEDMVDRCCRDLASAGVPPSLLDTSLWPAIEAAVVSTSDSVPAREQVEIYTFDPHALDAENDPFRMGANLWSFNFFLYNRRLKRILLFYGRCIRYSQH